MPSSPEQPSAQHCHCNPCGAHQHRPVPHTVSSLSSTRRDRGSSTSLGNQCLPTLTVGEVFSVVSSNLPCLSLRPFSLLLSVQAWQKRLTPPHYSLRSGGSRQGHPIGESLLWVLGSLGFPSMLGSNSPPAPPFVLSSLALLQAQQCYCSHHIYGVTLLKIFFVFGTQAGKTV